AHTHPTTHTHTHIAPNMKINTCKTFLKSAPAVPSPTSDQARCPAHSRPTTGSYWRCLPLRRHTHTHADTHTRARRHTHMRAQTHTHTRAHTHTGLLCLAAQT